MYAIKTYVEQVWSLIVHIKDQLIFLIEDIIEDIRCLLENKD